MPKEFINTIPDNDETIKVGWTKGDPLVQVAVLQRDKEGSLVEHDFEDKDLAPVYGNLDRDGCNRLIRSVRQARDDAFGKDE